MLLDGCCFICCMFVQLIVATLLSNAAGELNRQGLSEARSNDISLRQVAEFPAARRLKCF